MVRLTVLTNLDFKVLNFNIYLKEWINDGLMITQ